MDAGARGRRLLQRREYRAKVSEFIPKELEDQFSYDKNGELVFELDLKNLGGKIKRKAGEFFKKMTSGPIMKDYPTQQQYKNSVQQGTSTQYQSYEPEGEMIEANSEQMKAMHDAKMKKKEDDKVAAKKRDMKEGSAYGITRGSGKASGAMKDYLDKKKKEKKKVDEACWKGYEKKGMKTMFGKRYPNCVKKTKKEEVEVAEDMKGMSQKSGDKRSTESGAGMTAQGVAKYNRRTGGNLKTAVTTPPSKLKPGSKAAKRRKSFCARSKSWTGPRGKAARRRWNCSYEPELPMIIDEKKKLFNTAPLSDRVSNWSKKISEALTPDRNAVGLPKDLKSVEKKIKNSKTGRMNTGGDGTASRFDSYEPQGNKINELLAGVPGDGYLGHQKLGIKNPFANKQIKKTVPNFKDPGINVNKVGNNISNIRDIQNKAVSDLLNSHEPQGQVVQEMPDDLKNVGLNALKNAAGQFSKTGRVNVKNVLRTAANKALETDSVTKFLNKNSYEPQGEMIERKMTSSEKDKKEKYVKGMKKDKGGFTKRYGKDGKSVMYATATKMAMKKEEMTEAKYEKGASTYGKASIRNKRMFGKGGNAAPPEERGAAINVRRARHQERRYVKKGNKYHEPGKHRPEVHGVNKPEEERKGKNIKEGSLHSWFKGSKSKDGKPGWVNVVTGGTCASDKPGEGTPKCVSSSKRASMTKAERLSASRRKKKADPGQQSKSGAAKPTYVATDSKRKKK